MPDGRISQCGHIDDELLLQAKGHSFSLRDLLAGDEELTAAFRNGEFATTYLSPRDYHRVHMPCDATLRKMIYVLGDLFSAFCPLFLEKPTKDISPISKAPIS